MKRVRAFTVPDPAANTDLVVTLDLAPGETLHGISCVCDNSAVSNAFLRVEYTSRFYAAQPIPLACGTFQASGAILFSMLPGAQSCDLSTTVCTSGTGMVRPMPELPYDLMPGTLRIGLDNTATFQISACLILVSRMD